MPGLEAKIEEMKKRRGAVVLAHNYQRGEVQDIADFVGDSLELARKATRVEADVIVFCGVRFMAETAKILNMQRTVLMPDPHAGCPMADMAGVRELQEKKKTMHNPFVVSYVNTSAAVKAVSDICCTSANAVEVLKTVPADREILFVPDKSLGAYAAARAGRTVTLWPGYCPTHHRIRARDIREKKQQHPAAKVVVHPECTEDVVALADAAASTAGILLTCRETDAESFIVGTEIGLLHRLQKENPGKRFYAASELGDCPNMKLNTLEKILWCLEDMQVEVTVPDAIAAAARGAIERMLEVV